MGKRKKWEHPGSQNRPFCILLGCPFGSGRPLLRLQFRGQGPPCPRGQQGVPGGLLQGLGTSCKAGASTGRPGTEHRSAQHGALLSGFASPGIAPGGGQAGWGAPAPRTSASPDGPLPFAQQDVRLAVVGAQAAEPAPRLQRLALGRRLHRVSVRRQPEAPGEARSGPRRTRNRPRRRRRLRTSRRFPIS